MGWTSGFFGGGRNVDPETDGNNFGFGAAGSRAGGGDDVLLEDLEEDRTDLLRIILYGAFLEFCKIWTVGSEGMSGGILRINRFGVSANRTHKPRYRGCAFYACMCITAAANCNFRSKDNKDTCMV